MSRDARLDPKGLIGDSYQIEAITASECRSIFLDWALSLPAGQDPRAALRMLLARHGDAVPDHPMTAVLRAGLLDIATPHRRGGWRARRN